MLEITENSSLKILTTDYCSICFQHWTNCNCAAILDQGDRFLNTTN